MPVCLQLACPDLTARPLSKYALMILQKALFNKHIVCYYCGGEPASQPVSRGPLTSQSLPQAGIILTHFPSCSDQIKASSVPQPLIRWLDDIPTSMHGTLSDLRTEDEGRMTNENTKALPVCMMVCVYNTGVGV